MGIVSGDPKDCADLVGRFRPGKKPYVVFFIIFSPILFLYIFLSFSKDLSALQGVIVVLAMMLGFQAWIYSQTIELFRDRITYHSWFFRKRTIFLQDIGKWSIQVGVFKYTDRFKPTVRLEIHANKDLNTKPIIVPLKLFNKIDLDPLFDALPMEREIKPSNKQ